MKRLSLVLSAIILSILFIGCATTPPKPIYPSISNHIGSRDFHIKGLIIKKTLSNILARPTCMRIIVLCRDYYETVNKYRQIAVLPFVDAPNEPQSGQIAQGLANLMFAKFGFNVMERGRLFDVLSEQKLSSSGLIDTIQAIRIGKLLGVTAIVVGEVGQFSVRPRHTDTIYFPLTLYGKTTIIPIQGKQWDESFVSLSLRVIDVETSQVIYSASGQYDRGFITPPQQLAEHILDSIISKWVTGPGAIGYNPDLTPKGILVKEVFRDSPASYSGLRTNDLITMVNGKPTMNITELELKSLFWCNPGEKVLLEVWRGEQKLSIEIVAGSREKVIFTTAINANTSAVQTNTTKSSEVINNTSSRKYNEEAIAWTEKSTRFVETKNWSETIRTASAAIAIDPSYPEAYVNRSWAYLEKGFPEKALEDCEKALSLDSNNPRALNNRGLLYLRQGERNKGRDDFLKACDSGLQISCDNFKLITGYKPKEKIDFFLKKAEECFNSKDWDEVIKYTSEIISDNPQNEIALSIRAGAYAYKVMFDEAIKDCDAAIKMNPTFALAYNNKGFALELMGKKKEAMLNYEFACNLNMALGCDNLKRLIPAIKNQ